jgi:hypothetical protein
VDVLNTEEDQTILGIRPGVDSPETRAALAAWATATASVTGVAWVEGDDVVVAMDGSFASVEPADEPDEYAGIEVAVDNP